MGYKTQNNYDEEDQRRHRAYLKSLPWRERALVRAYEVLAIVILAAFVLLVFRILSGLAFK